VGLEFVGLEYVGLEYVGSEYVGSASPRGWRRRRSGKTEDSGMKSLASWFR